ncbi:hypothetical protein FHX10_003246 [Rhizobium sp. BK591]|nr:hypothetical protein [Rhizobium sp. BK591]
MTSHHSEALWSLLASSLYTLKASVAVGVESN